MRAFGSLPVARADQDFAVVIAFVAMKFVNWHATRIGKKIPKSKSQIPKTSQIPNPKMAAKTVIKVLA